MTHASCRVILSHRESRMSFFFVTRRLYRLSARNASALLLHDIYLTMRNVCPEEDFNFLPARSNFFFPLPAQRLISYAVCCYRYWDAAFILGINVSHSAIRFSRVL